MSVSQCPGWKKKLVEVHHTNKKDTPSGTSKKIAKIVNIRQEDIVSTRKDGVIGEHILTLMSGDEEIKVIHKAKSRDIFASGAIEIAEWTIKKNPGLYYK